MRAPGIFWGKGRAGLLAVLLLFVAQGGFAEAFDIFVPIGTLAPSETVTITYDVIIDDPLPTYVTNISSQGTVFASDLFPIGTDDPETSLLDDATDTPIVWLDFGDADESILGGLYPTLEFEDGARHVVPAFGAALYLGTFPPDRESDGQPDFDAEGDDLSGHSR